MTAAAVFVDPELRGIVDAAPAMALSDDVLADLRPRFTGPPMALGTTAAVERTDHVVDGGRGVIVRLHRPSAGDDGALPCLVSIHGGGYVLGSRDMDDARFERWCPTLGCMGASIEYRLAPEVPYPGAFEDCVTALAWIEEESEALGIDSSRIGVVGTSAGGGLAAALTIHARDRSSSVLRFQALECPMLDDRQRTESSRLEGLPIWSRESNRYAWQAYLGALWGGSDVPAYAAPARVTDLAGLPPAYISVGGADGFRDEDVAYAIRLIEAGVPTDLHVHAGAPHGFQLFGDVGPSGRAARDLDQWLGAQLRAPH